jgi:NADPH2:quinone reductase
MRAWRFHEFGPIGNLRLEEAPLPEPGPGEVLLRVRYAALNPADRFMVAAKYPRPAPRPFSVGRDACGVVERAAAGGRFAEGDEVIVLRSELGVSRTGTLAEYVAVPEESLAPLPAGWTPQEGAAGPLVHLTAWQGLVNRGALQPGQTVLVTGSSGGVGTAAIQQAKALGAKAIAMSRSEDKKARLRDLGADAVVDTDLATFGAQVKEALHGGRVDLVIENLGGPWLEESVKVCGIDGKIMVIGLLSGFTSEITLGLLIFKCIAIQGMNVGAETPAESHASWARIVETLEASGQRPLIDSEFGFEEVQEAFARMEAGPFGKVVVKVAG